MSEVLDLLRQGVPTEQVCEVCGKTIPCPCDLDFLETRVELIANHDRWRRECR